MKKYRGNMFFFLNPIGQLSDGRWLYLSTLLANFVMDGGCT